MRVAREEIFGPVLSVLTFRTPAEAVAKANNTPYGLSAGRVDGQGRQGDVDRAAQLRAGVVWTNTFNRFDPTSPFGGMGESGFGREGGRAGLAAYLDALIATSRTARRSRPSCRCGSPAITRRTARGISAGSWSTTRFGNRRIAANPRRVRYACRSRSRSARRSSRCSPPSCSTPSLRSGYAKSSRYGPTGTCSCGRGQPVEHDREPDAGLHRRLGQGVGQPDHRPGAAPLRAFPDGRRRTGSRHRGGKPNAWASASTATTASTSEPRQARSSAVRTGDVTATPSIRHRSSDGTPPRGSAAPAGPGAARERSPRRRRHADHTTRRAPRPRSSRRAHPRRRRAPERPQASAARGLRSTSASTYTSGNSRRKRGPTSTARVSRPDATATDPRNGIRKSTRDGRCRCPHGSVRPRRSPRTAPYAGLNRRGVRLITISGSGSPAPRRGSPSRPCGPPPWRACSRPAARPRGCCCSARRSAAARGRGRRRRGR